MSDIWYRKKLRAKNSQSEMPPRPVATGADGKPLIDISKAPSSMEAAAHRWKSAQ